MQLRGGKVKKGLVAKKVLIVMSEYLSFTAFNAVKHFIIALALTLNTVCKEGVFLILSMVFLEPMKHTLIPFNEFVLGKALFVRSASVVGAS